MERPAEAPQPGARPRFEIGYGLAEVTRLLRAEFDHRMRGTGLTGSSWRLIGALSREDGQTQAALAERLDVSRGAVGEAVDRLEKSGHVERRADPADRRVWRVRLTDLSRSLMPRALEVADEMQAEAFRDLSAEELATFEATLTRLRERLSDMKIETPDEETGR